MHECNGSCPQHCPEKVVWEPWPATSEVLLGDRVTVRGKGTQNTATFIVTDLYRLSLGQADLFCKEGSFNRLNWVVTNIERQKPFFVFPTGIYAVIHGDVSGPYIRSSAGRWLGVISGIKKTEDDLRSVNNSKWVVVFAGK